MSDKLHDLFPIPIVFVPGEQPSGSKFSAWSGQTNNAIRSIELVLGDTWGTNRPYTADSTRQNSLFTVWAKKDIASRSDKNDGEELMANARPNRDGQIANLSRLIGPASALNPRVLPSLTILKATWNGSGEVLSSGVSVLRLKHKPLTWSDVGFSATFSDTSLFNNEKATPELVLIYGDYHVTEDGVIYVAGKVETSTTVEYDYVTWDGDTYSGANFNVIPDPNQTANAFIAGTDGATDGVSVSWNTLDQRLIVTLPKITHNISNEAGSDTALVKGIDANFEVDMTLPDLLDAYSANDILPEGFIYLYDNKDRRVVRGGTYWYKDQKGLYITGLENLVANQVDDDGSTLISAGTGFNTWRYSLITVGTTVTQSIDHLRRTVTKHTHTGTDNTERIDHSYIFNRFGGVDSDLADIDTYGGAISSPTHGYHVRTFIESEIPSNTHPQYMHRHGYAGGGTDGDYADKDLSNMNDANVMRGDFVLGGVGATGYGWESGDALSSSEDSHSLWFGNVPSTVGGPASGAVRIFFDSDTDPGALNTELGDNSPFLNTTANPFNDKGLNITRGSIFFGANGDVTDIDIVSFGVQSKETILLANAGKNNVSDAGVEAYRTGLRFRAGYGASAYMGVRGSGITPWDTTEPSDCAVSDMDSGGYTGTIVLEASTHNLGLTALTGTSEWYGKSVHGAGLLISPGGGKGGSNEGVSTLTSGTSLARWTGGASADIGANRGGFAHIVAASTYGVIRQGLTTVGVVNQAPEQFQDKTDGDEQSPWGRIAIDSDRGIDLVVRTQRYLHEIHDNSTDLGETNLGGGSIADAGGTLGIFNGGNIAEIRCLTDLDHEDEMRGEGAFSSRSDTQAGADINLCFHYGKDYTRHNSSFTSEQWYGNPRSGTHDNPQWGWRGGRNYKLFGTDADDYGSNILGAGMVEAFRGIRHDPNQPPLLTYVFPFIYSFSDITTEYGALSRTGGSINVFTDFGVIINPYDCTFPSASAFGGNSVVNGYSTGWPIDQDANPITWDQVLKYHDNRHGELLGMDNVQLGQSLASMELMLQVWEYNNSVGTSIGTLGTGTIDYTGTTKFTSGSNKPRWVNASTGRSPYHADFDSTVSGTTPITENGTPVTNVPNYRMLWAEAQNDILWFSNYLSRGGAHGTTITAPFANLDSDYKASSINLNITFGSNPYNTEGKYLPYLVDSVGSVSPNQPDFDVTIYGRLVLTVFGDHPYRLAEPNN